MSSSRRTSKSSNSKSSRSSRSRSRAHLNHEWLMNFMSEMLAVEQGGVELYEKALDDLEHDDLREKLEQFHEQTQHHVELCEEMIQAAGGDSDSRSPGAEAAEHKAKGLMSAEVPKEMADINNIENLVLAETKDHWNWETLSSVMNEIEDRDLKKVVTRAVREVQRQERDHLNWTQKTLSKLASEEAHREEEMGEAEEDEGDYEEARE
jgi:rubrerythrin